MNEVVFKKRFNVKKDLFSDNEQGLWLDPSDMNAGKAGWRRNLLTYSEDLSNAAWTVANSATVDSATSFTMAGVTSRVQRSSFSGVLTVGLTYTASAYFGSADAGKKIKLGRFENPNWLVSDDLTIPAGGGVVTFTFTTTIAPTGFALYGASTETGTSFVDFQGIQLELGSTPTEYQRITDFSTEFKAAFPTHTLYQDSNGVTPCTAAGDPVGLILDQSRGGLGALGPELVTNGGFDDGTTGFSTPANATIEVVASFEGKSNVLKITNTNTSSVTSLQTVSGLTAGRWYQVSFDGYAPSANTLVNAATCYVTETSSNRVSVVSEGNWQTRKFVFLASSTSTQLLINSTQGGSAATGDIAYFDNLSIREVPGNHAYQTSSGARPTLARIPSSGRRNILRRTEEFDNAAAWAKNAVTVTANASSAPDGTTTMDTVVNTTATDVHGIYAELTTTAATAYTLSCYVKKNTVRYVSLGHWGGLSTNCGAGFDLDTGTVTGTGAIGTGYSATGASIQNVGGGIYRISVSVTQPTTVMYAALINRSTAYTSGSILESYAGQVTESTHVWGMQLELGSSPSNYQKVVATTDVTESGVGDLWHLVFDGSDDSLVTNAVDFNTWTQETRRNLLTETESFGASAWIKNRQTVTENSAADDLGNVIADKLIETAVSDTHFCGQNITVTSGQPYTLSVYAKAAERSFIAMGDSGGAARTATFNLTTGAITNVGAAISNPTATDMGNGWWRCSVTYTPSVTTFVAGIGTRTADGAFYETYLGDGTSGVLLTKAQLELGTLTDYQRVGTDEMTVIAGVRKLSDAAAAAILETSASVSANNGAFAVFAGSLIAVDRQNFVMQARGDAVNYSEMRVYSSPITSLLTGVFDISKTGTENENLVRINGGAPATTNNSLTDAGSGNFGNYPIYIGRRGGTTLPFNGHIYQLIVRGRTTPTTKLIEAEKFVGTKTGIMPPALSGSPTITGITEVGEILTATGVYVTGPTPITTTWQWKRDGVNIAGATSSTYTIRLEDSGSQLSVVQTATNSFGSDSQESSRTSVVSSFVPTSLFAANEQGVLYDLSEMTDAKTAWRRNLLTYSEQLTTSPWSANEASLESATPPSGISLAWKLKETGNSGVHFVGRVLNTVLSASVQHTLSVYAKAGERNILSIVGESTATTLCDFDLSAGTAHPAASATGTITSVGDGWYRCSMTWTAAASPSTTYFATKQSLAGGLVFTGTLNSGIFLAAAQLERASTPTEYQRITDFSTEFKAAFPTHTLYQDSNGVTPCTAAGQPVGLILDQSRGGLANLGPELKGSGATSLIGAATAATYDTTTGVGQVTRVDVSNQSTVVIPVTVGSWYQVTFQNSGSVAVWFRDGGPAGANLLIVNAGQTVTGIIRPTVGDVYIAASLGATVDFTLSTFRNIPGNHAYQSSSSARPTLARIPSSGRRNLLNESERFDQAYWTNQQFTVTPNAATSPIGTRADLVVASAVNQTHNLRNTSLATNTYTFSCYLKAAGETSVSLWLVTGSVGGQFTLTGDGSVAKLGGLTSASITNAGDGWYLCEVWHSVAGSTVHIYGRNGGAYTGNGTDGFYVAAAQAEPTASIGRTNYQKVVATHDVTESGFNDLWHLVFDGSDDSLVTNAVGFHQATEGIRKNFAINSDFITASTGVDVVAKADATTGLNSLTKTDSTTPRYVSSVGDSAFIPLGNTTYTVSTRIKYNGHDTEFSIEYNQSFPWGGTIWIARFNVTASSVTVASVNACTAAVINEEGGVYRISATFTTGASPSAGSTSILYRITGGTGVSIFAGDTQVEVGSSPTDYQRVGTDEMTVIAGVRKLSDAASAVLVELSTLNSNPGAFSINAPSGGGANKYDFVSTGTSTISVVTTSSAFNAPVTSVVSGLGNISGPLAQLRVNGTQVASSTQSQGSGNYGNHVLYLGRRAGTSFPFSGHLYQLIVRGKTTTLPNLRATEFYSASKIGITI